MLTSLCIKNFQNHSTLDVELDPHITCIIGGSDRGKSAIIRALRWVCTNRPSGDAHIQDGKNSCEVDLEIDDKTILRRKTPSVNKFAFNEQEYKSFGQDVPDPIADFLNLSPLNFQSQHDPPFWLSDTAGQVSRNLNAVVDLDVIDKSMSEVSRRLTKSKTLAEAAVEREKQTEDKVMELVWVPLAQKAFGLLEKKNDKILPLKARRASVAILNHDIVQTQKTWQNARESLSELGRVLSRGMELINWIQNKQDLSSMVEEAAQLRDIKAPDTSKLDKKARICFEITEKANHLDSILELIDKYENKTKYPNTQVLSIYCGVAQSKTTIKNQFEISLKEIEKQTQKIEQRQQFLEGIEKEIEEKTDGNCPLCGNRIGD